MPTISMFYGIIIRMYKEKNGKHSIPHIHASFGDASVVMSLEGEILEGRLPKNKQPLLEAWMEIHHDELEANWQLLCDGEPFFKIDPLR